MRYKCKQCGERVDDSIIFEFYNTDDEDMLVEIGSSRLCPECYDEAFVYEYSDNSAFWPD